MESFFIVELYEAGYFLLGLREVSIFMEPDFLFLDGADGSLGIGITFRLVVAGQFMVNPYQIFDIMDIVKKGPGEILASVGPCAESSGRSLDDGSVARSH